MPFDNPLAQDAAIPQGEYLELWESTRFRQGQPQQQQQQQHELHQDHNQSYHQNQNNLEPIQCPPTWLSTAIAGQPNLSESDQNAPIEVCPLCSSRGPCMCSSTAMHGGSGASSSTAFQLDQSAYANWLGAGIGGSSDLEHGPVGKLESDLQFRQQAARMATELNLSAAHGRDNAPQGSFPDLGQQSGAGTGQPSYTGEFMADDERAAKEQENWEELRRRCLIVTHPRYQEMLERHAECLRVGTPMDQLPTIEAQLEEAATVTEKYRVLRDQIAEATPDEQAELDEFMNQYPPMLGGFRDTLQNHVYNDVTEGMMSCWELEQKLIAITGLGVRLEDGAGATMSDDDVDYDSDYGSYDQGIDYNDGGGFGPLVPTDTERTLMERMRQELKHELKQGYKSKIEDVREEILRKRRAGKLPEGTTTVLKAWWQAHSKWPYPTEDEKEVLIQETGLELKQVNNWFINQRKRNWHSNPLASAQSSDSAKNKARKSW